ncbi:MFS general substrate transporter [Auriscalpium vulgare]|uniref:MFS general substrate transporter n=1 Tax=Auriscalpium vulgare TaxID=40419 RepID=A0ACB8RZK1_9AGAM|nr:MFS general substrate transporter [Auriscalpium vulgare]
MDKMASPESSSIPLSALPSPTATIIEHEPDHGPRSPIDEEAEDDEKRIERYGADDPAEPRPKDFNEKILPASSASSIHKSPKVAPAFTPQPIDPNQVTWDGPNDQLNPQNWSNRYKWWVTAVCSVMTVNVTFASSAPSSATLFIKQDLHTSTEVSYLVTSIFLVGYVFGPMFWGPGSELVGRRPIFIVTLALYTLFHIGQAHAQNITTLLVTRFFSGFFACAPLTNGGGVMADIWDPINRGIATSVFAAAVFLGPVIGPVVGGYVTVSSLGWRWVFWVMMIFAGACTSFAFLFLPETYAPAILAAKAKRLRKQDPVGNKDVFAESERVQWSPKELIHRTILRPFKMLLVEPILLLVTVYLSVVYGVLYALFEAFPVIFIRTHGLTIPQDGLIFLGVGIGAVLAMFVNIYLLRPYPRLMVEWRGFPPAEIRLYGAMIAGPGLVVGALWLGWTGNYASVHWSAPAISAILIGMSVVLVFMSFLSYLVDTYLMYAASAFAANTIVRSAVGAAFPLFTVQMFENLGTNWAATLIAGIALLLAPIPFLFFKYGARIRSKSQFAPCIDLKIAKQIAQEKEAAENKGEV